ncbi:MAG: type IX secretion system membrane protein PorP/SprF [Saprospiraceae bacterium]|nr:type IX secretion system membrane protein PorP/SprF [Saprospiraceae bacterium]MBK7525109.1 type IX secretion system membrane protein PorP/SprF [Saprospiraceae bacterium]MBK8079824.1 type IX secretion system membrane protein PorP/SprF [Saprospiraceae bacterium]MBK8547981.1 type IX secretion system membrane protein PorP/SprF [Saprospiraceae bacterium]MBK8820087.1 type IX secretion system membrane protein PorP/SprF [Saprospiraceae bacterium]
MRKELLIVMSVIGLVLIGTNGFGQQQQMYTQFMYNKLSVNPAYSGNENYTSFTLMHRSQWIGLKGAPQAQVFTINFPRIAGRLGAGLNFERQSIGITEKITYEGMYAYKFSMGIGTLSMGMNVSGRSYVQDYTDPSLYAIQGIQNDPSIPLDRFANHVFNAGFGVYYNTKVFYVGASVPRMIRSELDFDKNNFFSTEVRHLYVMTGGSIAYKQDFRFTPQVLIRMAENSPFTFDINMMAVYKDKYSGGLTYRSGGGPGDWGESIGVIASLQVNERWMTSFAYDFTLSDIQTVDHGSVELCLFYNLVPKKIKTAVVNPRYF